MRTKPLLIGGALTVALLAASQIVPSIAQAASDTITYSSTVTFRGVMDVKKYIMNSVGKVSVEDDTMVRKNFGTAGGYVLTVVQKSKDAPQATRSVLYLKSEAPTTSPNDYLIYSKYYGVKVNGDTDTPGSLTVGKVITANGGLTVPNGKTLTMASGSALSMDGATVTGLATADLSDASSVAMLGEAETISGNWVNTTSPWAADEIADVTRVIQTAGSDWILSTGAIPTDLTTPNLVTSAAMIPLEWASGETTQKVLYKLVVPPDYSSTLTLHVLADKQTISSNDETLSVRWASANSTSTSDPTLAAEDATAIPNTDAWSDVTVALDRTTIAAGDNLIIEAGMNAINEVVRLQGLWFTYTAKQ